MSVLSYNGISYQSYIARVTTGHPYTDNDCKCFGIWALQIKQTGSRSDEQLPVTGLTYNENKGLLDAWGWLTLSVSFVEPHTWPKLL